MGEIERWRKRTEGRQQSSIKEQERTQLLITELREEFGYDINMNDPQFADKIAEKKKARKRRKNGMSKEKKLVLRNPKHCQNNRVYLILYSTTLVENIYIQISESKINIFLLNST